MHNPVLFLLGLGLPVVVLAKGFYKPNITLGNEEIIFDSTEIIVNPGDVVKLMCGMKGHTNETKIQHCVWTNKDNSYQIQDVYQGVFSSKRKPENTEGNQCGIVVNSIKNEDNGQWKCSIFLIGRHLAETKNIIVTVKPTDIVAPSEVIANDGVKSDVGCTVGKARPAADITWTLNDIDITEHARQRIEKNFKIKTIWVEKEVDDTKEQKGGRKGSGDKDTENEKDKVIYEQKDIDVPTTDYKTISTLSYTFNRNENNTKLKCIINHHSLESKEIREMTVIVGIAPTKIEEKNYYNVSRMSNHTIRFNYTVSDLPKPKTKWNIGHDIFKADFKADETHGKYQSSLKDLGDNTYEVALRINNVDDDDYQKYIFEVESDSSKTLYNFNVIAPKEGEEEDSKDGSNSINSAWFLCTLLSILALLL